ncbi:MAG: tRNA (adenine(22)-N(1))-methyltransferase TrmK [Flavonifractor plautii]
MRTVELTPRLRSVAELVPRGARFADVGTDHAYLPVWLLQQGRITGAVASDLRPGPLERARGTAEKYWPDRPDGLPLVRRAVRDTAG